MKQAYNCDGVALQQPLSAHWAFHLCVRLFVTFRLTGVCRSFCRKWNAECSAEGEGCTCVEPDGFINSVFAIFSIRQEFVLKRSVLLHSPQDDVQKALLLSGQMLKGQTVMVKSSEVSPTADSAGGLK